MPSLGAFLCAEAAAIVAGVNVVLVHGFLNRGSILRRLADHLRAEGHVCFVPSLKPCDARCGLPKLAEELDRYIRASVPDGTRFALVGFSMGALICRYYLQEMAGVGRVNAFFSIAGPHTGTLSAFLYPGIGVRQMRPGSAFLRQLELGTDRLAGLPLVCYWTPFDLMIRPVSSTRWPRAEHVRILTPLHSLLVFSPTLLRDVARRIAALSS
ncbi:lipase [Opitutaceae bacterium EW11]|nr:lipase [Opitutaceae bacterium EW11]